MLRSENDALRACLSREPANWFQCQQYAHPLPGTVNLLKLDNNRVQLSVPCDLIVNIKILGLGKIMLLFLCKFIDSRFRVPLLDRANSRIFGPTKADKVG